MKTTVAIMWLLATAIWLYACESGNAPTKLQQLYDMQREWAVGPRN